MLALAEQPAGVFDFLFPADFPSCQLTVISGQLLRGAGQLNPCRRVPGVVNQAELWRRPGKNRSRLVGCRHAVRLTDARLFQLPEHRLFEEFMRDRKLLQPRSWGS